eukprot:CAMPEP_0171815872 /NCGR_PEP_ID=MMETSP0992-20121227/163_1 /TAXON_ID=483369 /ORGANISM="non described non described, Strain CCMP2098" /LENGTH=190 /DNA_ID=CAMNT_0012429621 /DNA_START=162 /DNA_END=731 /DNA_ORIENTATION=+
MRLLLAFAALKGVWFATLYYSEWTQVVVSGDRCLYPESFHIFTTEICLGNSHGSSSKRGGPLCLPLDGSEEFDRLPPTEDRTLLNFGLLLDTVCQMLVISPLVFVSLKFSASADNGNGKTDQSFSPFLTPVLHLSCATLAAIAIGAALSAPTASASHWANGLQTCDVSIVPGAAVPIALISIFAETALAW